MGWDVSECQIHGHTALLYLPHAILLAVQILEVQPPTKKAIAARDFRNGLQKKTLLIS